MRCHEGPLRRYLRRLAGEEADDLAQEALLAAWRKLRQWRGEGSFAAWLRQIATRRFLDRLRKEKNRTASDPVELGSGTPAASPFDQRIAVDNALASLGPQERAAALLVFAEGHSHGEAAVILGIPLGTLKSLVARARSRLIPLLEGVSP